MNLVQFPDTDTLAHAYLLQGLAENGVTGIEVGTKVPSPMPDRFIRCFTLPGREICRRTMWCQVITYVYDDARNDVRCSELARLCGAVLRSASDMVVDGEQMVTEPCEKHGPFPSQDPDLPDIPRYQVNVTWTVQSSV